MKYYVIAGEKSGDLHTANLIKKIKLKDPNAIFRGFGGDDMLNEGVTIVKHYKEMAFMGFLEVIKNLGSIFKNINQCKEDILKFKPDVIILTDYPGFNLRIAAFAHQAGIKVFYYISPKIWAWNTKRAYKIKKFVDKMFVIFPFETAFYKKYNYDVDYVGNPLLDAISQFEKNHDFFIKNNLNPKIPIIAVLPGSRKQELLNILPPIAEVFKSFPDYQFVIGGVSTLSESLYHEILKGQSVKIIFGQSYDLLSQAVAGLIKSGTSTLEAALFDLPQVVCYKTSGFSYKIAKALIKVKYISLVNLIADKKIVTELIQDDLNPSLIIAELQKILPGAMERKLMEDEYKILQSELGNAGASEKAAGLMWNYLNN